MSALLQRAADRLNDPELIEKRTAELMKLPAYDTLHIDNFREAVAEMDGPHLQRICDLMRDRCSFTDEVVVNELKLASWQRCFPRAHRDATAEIEEEAEDLEGDEHE